MVVKAIKDASVKGHLKLGIDTGEGLSWFLVSEGQYESIDSPLIGDELSEDSFRTVLHFEEYNRAKRRALNILAFGDNSSRELLMKLSRAGISRPIAEKVRDEMIRLGYIDEERQLLRLVENEATLRLVGPKKIIAKLVSKGYAPEKIKSAMHTLELEGRIDFQEIRAKLTEEIESDEEKRKLLYKKAR